MIRIRIAFLPAVQDPLADAVQPEDDSDGEDGAEENADQAAAGHDVMEEDHEQDDAANDEQHHAGAEQPSCDDFIETGRLLLYFGFFRPMMADLHSGQYLTFRGLCRRAHSSFTIPSIMDGPGKIQDGSGKIKGVIFHCGGKKGMMLTGAACRSGTDPVHSLYDDSTFVSRISMVKSGTTGEYHRKTAF